MRGNFTQKHLDGIYELQKKPFFEALEPRQNRFQTKIGWFSIIIIFLFIASSLWLYLRADKLKNISTAYAKEGENHFSAAQDAITAKNINQAIIEFSDASKNFQNLDELMTKSGQKSEYLKSFRKTKNTIIDSQNLIELAQNLSLEAQISLFELNSLTQGEKTQNLSHQPKADQPLAEKIASINQSLTKIANILESLKKEAGQNSALSEDFEAKLEKTSDLAETATEFSQFLPEIIGEKSEKNYLLMFQNPAEARATGGMIGNYGILSVEKGKIKDLKINNIYALKYDFLAGKEPNLISDIPLSLTRKDLHAWEGNWNADFPKTAQKIAWIYTQYGGRNPDGVIALDPKLIEDILNIVGPIEMPKYKTTLTSANFRRVIERKVEIDNDFKKGNKTVNPKQILTDFGPLLTSKIELSTQEQKIAILEAVYKNLSTKHILLFSQSNAAQKVISYLGWSGEIQEFSRDFLMIANTNISGTKSSLDVIENTNLYVNILEDGSVINEVVINHDARKLKGFLRRGDKSFIQVLVPLGSELIDAEYDGKKVPKSSVFQFQEDTKTVFAYNNLSVWSGQEKSITFRYRLPFKINQEAPFYSLLVQKQPGTLANNLGVQIFTPKNLNVSEVTNFQKSSTLNMYNYLGNLETDRFMGLFFRY